MSNFNIHSRIRPIRLGFATNLKDEKTLLKIFEINSCLWGGIYNPIIPYNKSTSKDWHNRLTNPIIQDSNEIFDSYINFFEPDFLVIPQGLEETFGFNKERVIKLDTILCKNQNHRYSLNASIIYQYIDENKTQFINRYKNAIIYPHKDADKNNLLSACLVGSFPENYPCIKKKYDCIFNPSLIGIDNDFLGKFSAGRYFTPLKINQFENIDFCNHHYDNAQIFILEKSVLDLIDFWNFRLIYPNIILLPYENAISSPYLLKTIIENLQKVKSKFPPNIILSRSISSLQEEELSFKIKDLGKICTFQTWFPAFWEGAGTIHNQYPRLTISAKPYFFMIDPKINHSKDSFKIEFETTYPKFAEDLIAEFTCANVLELTNNSYNNSIALTYPINPKDSSFLTLTWKTPVLSTTEGLVIFSDFFKQKEIFQLNSGSETLKNWFNKYNIKTSISSAGSSTDAILRILPCLATLGSICYKDVISTLQEMALKPTKSMKFRAFKGAMKKATKIGTSKGSTCHPFNNLIKCGVVKLGKNIKCTLCGQWNWYKLEKYKEKLTCNYCLRDYDFPIYEPENTDLIYWALRVVGPFSTHDLAHGGYSAALSIGFFQFIANGDGILWSPGLEFTFGMNEKYEADFVLLFQQKINYRSSTFPVMIFGESKSYGKYTITEKEIKRLKILVEKFPGSAVVISTLRDKSELQKKELEIIRELCLWGREYDPKRSQIKCPVIILTGEELFNMFSFNILEKTQHYGPSKIYSLAMYTQYKNLSIAENSTILRTFQKSIN